MDTINLKICVNSREGLNKLKRKLEKVRYCKPGNVIDGTHHIRVKLSYPKYFDTSNAYLITSAEEVKQVNKDFIRIIEELDLGEVKIKLLRLDIPFTINMEQEDSFHSYRNIFNYFARAYANVKKKSDPKSIMQELTQKKETYILADTKKASDYNSKIIIYNQSKRFRDCYDKIKNRNINLKYTDLDTRIRIEVSKRINRENMFTLEEFHDSDLYDHYYTDYIDYILDNLMNEFILDDIYDDDISKLAELFKKSRRKSNFSYDLFIHENISVIKSYRVLKEAVNEVIDNAKTRENAITKIRGVLRRIESKEEIIIIGVQKEISNMRKEFESLKRKHKKNSRK